MGGVTIAVRSGYLSENVLAHERLDHCLLPHPLRRIVEVEYVEQVEVSVDSRFLDVTLSLRGRGGLKRK